MSEAPDIMGNRILVTGASGWLGIAIVQALLARGDDVIGTDLRAASGVSSVLAARHPRFDFLEADLTEWPQVMELFRNHRPDLVIHAAAVVGVASAAEAPLNTLRANVDGSVNLLEAMRFHDVSRVVYLSTEETYGDFDADLIDEEHSQKPTSIYGLTKLAAEHYGRVYAQRYGMEFVTVRTCWVYGPHLPRPRVPKIFVDAALAGIPCHLEAGADMAVDQVYIDDVVAGVLLALDKPSHRYDAYHIATGQAPTLGDVARVVRELVPGADVSVAPGRYLHGNRYPTARKGALDISRARTELGYEPKYDLRLGLAKTIDATREELALSLRR